MYAKVFKANPYRDAEGRFSSKNGGRPSAAGIEVKPATMRDFNDAMGIKVRPATMKEFNAAQKVIDGKRGVKKSEHHTSFANDMGVPRSK